MDFKKYQLEAVSTAIYPKAFSILYPALGVCSEAGEVAGKIKKILRDEEGDFTPDKKEEISQEIGDVLWYLATLSNDLGFSLDKIAEENIKKLRSRQDRGVLGGSGDDR